MTLQEVYTDGTKIESKANRYTFVWGKSIKLNKERIKKQLKELWDYTQNIAQEELEDTSPTTFEQIDSEKVADTIKKINKALKAKARALLLSEEGIRHRKKRPWEVESVFGNIKHNKGFKRFMLTGCDKVEIEAGLLSIANNLAKWKY